jgi:pimeloyl-ACP methyl ester carboxylesterase
MTAPTIARVSYRFTIDGRQAACIALRQDGASFGETWALTHAGPRLVRRTSLGSDPDSAVVLGLDDGRLLHAWWKGGRQYVSLLPDGAEVPLSTAGGARLLSAPPGRATALSVVAGADGPSHIYLVNDDLSQIGPIASTDALLGRSVVAGCHVVFSAHRDRAVEAMLLDLERGTLAPLAVPRAKRAVPLAAAGDMVLFGLDTADGHQLGVAPAADPEAMRLYEGPSDIEGTVLPLALSPDAGEVLLRLQRGVRSSLVRYHLATGNTSHIEVPAGTIFPLAAWPHDALWLPHATPDRPTTLWWNPPGQPGLVCGEEEQGHWVPAQPATFPGAAGPVEAVVYGADWRTAERIVITLHGGPSEHWDLGFDHRMQRLATKGTCVVAPNQRGSTGYGRDHEYAIKGAWGGPDLADIVAIGAHLRSGRGHDRRAPGLLGTSYGAYLGLLAAACAPDLWSGCVAVAPFLSGARLYPEAGPRVRALLDRLDGTAELDDEIGPRDLLRLAPRMRGPVMLVHGESDTVIPVGHARALATALQDQPGVTLVYREVAGAGHDLLRPEANELISEVDRFLSGTPTPAASAS